MYTESENLSCQLYIPQFCLTSWKMDYTIWKKLETIRWVPNDKIHYFLKGLFPHGHGKKHPYCGDSSQQYGSRGRRKQCPHILSLCGLMLMLAISALLFAFITLVQKFQEDDNHAFPLKPDNPYFPFPSQPWCKATLETAHFFLRAFPPYLFFLSSQ